MKTVTCFELALVIRLAAHSLLIIPSVSLAKITRSHARTDNFVIVNVFNSITSSRVTGNRDFARKKELKYQGFRLRPETGRFVRSFPVLCPVL